MEIRLKQTLGSEWPGMLKAVDSSFEVPTAEPEAVTLKPSVGRSLCDFTLATAQTPPHTRPSISPHTERQFICLFLDWTQALPHLTPHSLQFMFLRQHVPLRPLHRPANQQHANGAGWKKKNPISANALEINRFASESLAEQTSSG